jgi:Flp pilus assembly protein TadG
MVTLKDLLAQWRREDGAELVEFALTFPLLLLVVLGIMDFGLLFQQYGVITNAAREGARVAVLPGYTAADAQARVAQYIDAAILTQGAAVTTTVSGPQQVSIGASCMSTMTVTVTYPHTFVFLADIGRFFNSSFGVKVLTASTSMRSEAPGSCS